LNKGIIYLIPANLYTGVAYTNVILENNNNGGVPLKERLTSDETLSLILAVIGHDIGHLGKTNIFLEKTKHEFYLDNPDSPNEAMHFRLFSEKIHKWVSQIHCCHL